MYNRPVILIHGLWGKSSQMEWLAAFLQKQSFNTKIYELSTNDGSISLHVLARGLHDFIERENISECDIVGYSMGGMIAQLYIQEYDGNKRVKKCITISSPHHGTIASYFLHGKGLKELRPNSDFIKKLILSSRTNTIPWLSIYTPLDLMVMPANSSKIEFGENKTVLVPFHHMMITDKKVARYVSDFLK